MDRELVEEEILDGTVDMSVVKFDILYPVMGQKSSQKQLIGVHVYGVALDWGNRIDYGRALCGQDGVLRGIGTRGGDGAFPSYCVAAPDWLPTRVRPF